jgi:hypothetical protein
VRESWYRAGVFQCLVADGFAASGEAADLLARNWERVLSETMKERENNVSRGVGESSSHRRGRLLAGTLEACFSRACGHSSVAIDFKWLEDYLTERRRAVALADFLLST